LLSGQERIGRRKPQTAYWEREIDKHHVVGIGASAGGLEAIHELFDNMPAATGFFLLLSFSISRLDAELLAWAYPNATI